MIDDRFCVQIGTEKQHKYLCFLLSRAGHACLRSWVAGQLGCSASKMSRRVVTVKEASALIDAAKSLS